MNYLKNIGITTLYMLLIILLTTLFITSLNYFNVIGKNMLSIFKILIAVSTLFIGGFMMGKKSKQKGWLEGLKLGLIFIIILVLFNTLGLQNKIEFKNILYYMILIISSIFGGMIGINKSIKD